MNPGKRGKGKGPSGSGDSSSSRRGRSSDETTPSTPNGAPGYMTVGSGSTPEAAARLVSMLDNDSGYGGSMMDGDASGSRWRGNIGEDQPSASPTPILSGDSSSSEHDKQRSHVLQLRYNQNKNALGRAIHGTIDTLKSFQEMNLKWPAHYPSVQTTEQKAHVRNESRPGLQHTQSAIGDFDPMMRSPERPRGPRRAGTTIGEDFGESSSAAAAEEPEKEAPRLVTPQLAQDFSVLKLELRMGGRTQTDLVHSLEKSSIASLLDGQIQQSVRHLYALKERIEDTSSKVLVTGDLNAGKSTFCNALLRRKVLPEDQQPCTSIFCEVLDFRENGNVEEVHAIPHGSTYKRNDESTYVVFDLKDLEKIVIDNDRFSQCKIYIQDIRGVDESILNNGVVDIALIDAPGLNADSVMTTAVFARQEEIDVVVFVVSAANHFTESAKNFIFNAAREKAYIFMVVNGFDAIRDQQRCQEMILKQVHGLSPATFKESSELVHFVSSNAIPMGGSGSSPPDGDGDDDPSDKGKGKEADKRRDFGELETSLRRFVLEKRARSKLAPAKTYLLNVLGDMNNLATVNRDVSQSELDRVKKEIEALEPEFEDSKKSRTEAGEAVERMVEDTTSEVYGHTRDTLTSCIQKVGEQDLGIPYPGLFSAYQYAEDIRDSMIHEVSETVKLCEEHAKTQTVQGYNAIKNLGVLHLGNSLYADVMFRPERMFNKAKHQLVRQVDIDIELWDFFDVASLWERQEKFAGTGMAVTVAGMVGGRLMGGAGWIDGALGAAKIMGTNNMRRLLIPGLIAGGKCSSHHFPLSLLTCTVVAVGVSYVLSSVPKSLPHRLSAKLAQQLAAIDYTHQNALRISSEIRRALKGPANDVRIGLQRNVEKLQNQKEQTSKFKAEAEVARKYFGNLVRETNNLQQTVNHVNLEAAPPAAISAPTH
jgi:GTPase SAR1 family protein